MKRFVLVVLLSAFFMCPLFSADESQMKEARFMQYPDIHGKTILFTYEGDLWTVGIEGGTAARITTFPGVENGAKFSPDGKSIAFTGTYDASRDIYTMPAGGGEPKRLTYLPRGGHLTTGWTPDGEKIVFRSTFRRSPYRDGALYYVHKNGSAPEPLPMVRGTRGSFSADGKKILYTRKGREDYYWKRYRGGRYPDIWMYDFSSGAFEPMTKHVGKNTYPMWIGDRMAFVSDRGEKKTANLYWMRLPDKKITPITTYADYDVMWPSSDSKSIVFVYNGYVHRMDVASGKIGKIDIRVPTDSWRIRTHHINPSGYIHYAHAANDGKAVAIEARGDLFYVPATSKEHRATLNLTQTPGEREMYPRLSPAGNEVAYFSDKTGEYQLYIMDIKSRKSRRVTDSLDRAVYDLIWSPDGKNILFGNKDIAVFYVNLATKKVTEIDRNHQLKNDEFFWKINDYNWSPDGKWVCYSLVRYNKNSQILLYSLVNNKKYAVTGDFYDNLSPAFDASGKYLYYLSSRNFDVQMDFYEDNHVIKTPQQVMVVQLQAGETPPFAEPAAGKGKKAPAKDSAAKNMVIDTGDFASRTFPLPVKAGNYFHLKAAKGKVLWSSLPIFTETEYEEIFEPRRRSGSKWTVHMFDMESEKEVSLKNKVKNFRVSGNGAHLMLRKGNDFYLQTVDAAFSSKADGKKVDLSGMIYKVDYRAEWNQILTDAWRWYRDFFYDRNMHGNDWKAIGDAYRAMLPSISSRNQLNWLLSQMVGELCVGHTYVFGGDYSFMRPPTDRLRPYTGLLGADLEPSKSGYYQFKTIYGPTKYNLDLKGPLSRPDIEIKEGWYLLAINGKEIKAPESYFKHLQVVRGRKVSITANSQPSMQGAKTYEVTPLRFDSQLRYFHWIAGNIEKVLKASNGRLGYMHITAMGDNGVAQFDKYWRAFRYKEGIVLDLRGNGGGWTEYFLIDKLERKQVGFNVVGGVKPFRYPGPVANAKYVVLSNEYNGSDGECFIEHFKARKLGTVIGVPSWGGLVGIINGQPTIDNGVVHQPNNAFYGKEGKWWVENHGADPDIFLDNDPTSVKAGKDLQLERAIEEALKQIEKEGNTEFPKPPPYPKR